MIEVPAFYSRISGFDFFADPWYNNNVLYVIYHQPPFSKSAGHGNSHETKMKPNGTRVGYADALARECNNPWAAAYARTILEKEPDIMKKSFLGKAGDLTWYRCITDKALPKEEHSLAELPMTKVFNETGIATMHTSLGDIEKNAMLSFRSSPYGSTSHWPIRMHLIPSMAARRSSIAADIVPVLPMTIVCIPIETPVHTTVFWSME